MTDQEKISRTFEERAEEVLTCAFYGIHHCPDIKKFPGEFGRWEVNTTANLATFDTDFLTRLVVSAHDNCVRVSILSSGPRMVKIQIHNRKGREGNFCDRHPTINEAIIRIRKGNP